MNESHRRMAGIVVPVIRSVGKGKKCLPLIRNGFSLLLHQRNRSL